jgi:hypothetical protein
LRYENPVVEHYLDKADWAHGRMGDRQVFGCTVAATDYTVEREIDRPGADMRGFHTSLADKRILQLAAA